jgi:hypothetical protein
LGVTLFRFLKSMQILIFPVFFFSTGTMLETHSTYLVVRMKLA